MKATTKHTTSNTKTTTKPFVQKKGDGGFFSTVVESPQPFFQPKLTIGSPNDKYEKEADATADRVVQRLAQKNGSKYPGTSNPKTNTSAHLQTKCNNCEMLLRPIH